MADPKNTEDQELSLDQLKDAAGGVGSTSGPIGTSFPKDRISGSAGPGGTTYLKDNIGGSAGPGGDDI